MVGGIFSDVLLHPLGIYVLALGAGFLIPLFDRAHRHSAVIVFLAALAGMVAIAAGNLLAVSNAGAVIEIETAGIAPPFSINLRFGLFEGAFALAVNAAALLAAWHYLPSLRQHASALLLYLIMVMGINGVIMTRDLFNLFIFIEITSLATYALIGMERTGSVLAAGFKYIIATSVATTFFLLGTILIYYQTGTLNIDDILQRSDLIQGPVGLIATLFVLTSLLIELKPYPANGWGLDVYETAHSGIASLVSVGVSAGVLFALYKLMPLMGAYLDSIAVIGGITFLFSNVIGLKQDNARRLLGYSSIGQMALLVLALALLTQLNAASQLALVVGGLFINHLLAKAGLFWLAGIVDRRHISDWSALARKPGLVLLFGIMIAALIGLPPFPGFWAKWQLVMVLADGGRYAWIALILLGSLLEAAYLFRWFSHARRHEDAQPEEPAGGFWQPAPVAVAALLLLVIGYLMAANMVMDSLAMFVPLAAAFVLWLLDAGPARLKNPAMLAVVGGAGYWLTQDLDGINRLFAYLLVGGGLLVSVAAMARGDARKGFYPWLALLLLSLAVLLRATTSLEFFFGWELMTLSSYLLITLGREGVRPALTYLLFSLASAYFIFAGFALAYASTGSLLLASLGGSTLASVVFSLLAAGFVIKLGGFGFHVWLPDAYAEADDDFTALLSAVVSKAGVFGLVLVAAHLGIRADIGLDPAYVLGWIGILTATFGALMAVFQADIKRLVAYSSMGQLGYIVTGIALMSHLGWVTALYLTVNHFLFKGILFLSVAGIVLRTNQRLMYRMGGLIKNMPFTFVFTMIAIIAMSGVPPLTGFGGKWMLFNALMEKGWYFIAAFAFFSSAVAFLYMFRLLQTVFLGQRKLEHQQVREAPAILLAPQFVMIAAIMVISAYPKLLLDPLSAAVDPWIANTLVWEGFALQTRYGYWNAPLIMAVVGGVWMVPLIILALVSLTMKIQKVEQFNIVYAAERPHRPEDTHFAYNFFAHYDRAIGFLVRPRATAFWNAAVEWSHTLGSTLRVFYNGNGQTYALFILIYFVAMVVLNGGLAQ